MPKKLFRFNLGRLKGGSKYRPGTALPPSQSGSQSKPARRYRNETTAAAEAVEERPAKKSNGLFSKNKGPGGMEVAAANNSNTTAQDDLVSAITPVTGLPPDHQGRRNLPSLLSPRHHQPLQQPLGLYSNTPSPKSSPSRGDMKINIRHHSQEDEDDISVMTPVTGVPPISPDNKAKNRQQRYAPPHILEDNDDDDDEDSGFMVFEDDAGSAYSGMHNNNNNSGPTMMGGTSNVAFKLNPRNGPLNTSLGVETILKSGTAGTTNNNGNSTKDTTTKAWKILQAKKSWLTQTEYFQKAIDTSFDMVDVDKSGDVTLEELYAGLLLIHLNMAVYVGAPACRPASKEYVTEMFKVIDIDGDGTLNKEEFTTVMKILYSQVFTRIVIHWLLTLMIVPVISQYIIRYSILFYTIAHEFWKDIDDELDPIQRLLWKLWALFLRITPTQLDRIVAFAWHALCKVPNSIWKSMPFTMLTVAQTSIALPYALTHVEGFFRRAAHSDKRVMKERGTKLKDC